MSKILWCSPEYVAIRLNYKELKLAIRMVNDRIPKQRSLSDRLFGKFGRTGVSQKELQQLKQLSSVLHEARKSLKG